MRTFFVVVVLLGLLSFPVMAQDNPKAEVFGGWQYQHLGGSGLSVNIPEGWDASVTGNINKHFGVTGDFSGSYKSETVTTEGVTASGSAHLYTYTGGPVVAMDFGGKINPFAHALFGGFTVGGSASGCITGGGCASGSASTNGYTVMAGGGVDAKVAKSIAIRLAQFDWIYYHANGGSIKSNVRIASGVVFRF